MHASRRIGRGNWSNYVVGIGIFGLFQWGSDPNPRDLGLD